MKFAATTALLLSAALVSGAPAPLGIRGAAPTDTQVLQLAMNVENLEGAFYEGALAKFDEAAFRKAGLPSFARGRLVQIAGNEAFHAKLLRGILGKDAPAPCKYSFPYKTPVEFVALAAVLEGGGVSAYSGALAAISNKKYLTVAGEILPMEARHNAFINGAIRNEQPFSSPVDTPLTPNDILTLVTPFIVSCPPTNPKLPFHPNPSLSVNPPNAPSGTEVTFTFKATRGHTYYAHFLYGLEVKTVKLSGNKAKVPANLFGTYYVIITSSRDSIENVVAGPAISIVDFDANAVLVRD
jgi:hypothetical protein